MKKFDSIFLMILAMLCGAIAFYQVVSCVRLEDPVVVEIPKGPIVTKTDHCQIQKRQVNLGYNWSRTVIFPAKGKFVEESHYVTTDDGFTRTVPRSGTDRIAQHLQRSWELYKAKVDSTVKFDELYRSSWEKVWTPSEGGDIGAGSVGFGTQVKELTPWMEMWQGNMMWKSASERPRRGEKWLVCSDKFAKVDPHVTLEVIGKCAVIQMGYETGPSSEKFLGGLTTEVHFWLQTGNEDVIRVGPLVDQSLPLGPVECG